MQSPNSRPRFAYPVSLDLDGVVALVVGGGRVGARKASGLAASGARVRLVAADVGAEVDRSIVDEIRERPFVVGDLDGVRLVITATGDEAVDRAVSAAARSRGLWTNAADQPVDCDFILPAIGRVGRVTVAVGTDGASPALAGVLRDRIVALLDELDAGAVAEQLAQERAAHQASGRSTEDTDWRPRVDDLLDG